ncbi:hypothetical protein C8R46DRAFT_1159230 [Mycena filopes]|nr:hypothetical protein C8R46DRAFT_1159230 [Mycena filopes]
MFLRVSVILATTTALHVAVTPPDSPTSEVHKHIPTSHLEFILTSKYLPKAQLLFYWLVAFAECAAIGGYIGTGRSPARVITAPLAIGSFFVVIGALIRCQCYTVLGRHFTFEPTIRVNHKLVKSGPYSWVRHPSYAGAVLVYGGLILYYSSGNTWFRQVIHGNSVAQFFAVSWAAGMTLVIIGLLFRIPKEDRALKEEFGDEWDQWVEKVPCVIIPRLY